MCACACACACACVRVRDVGYLRLHLGQFFLPRIDHCAVLVDRVQQRPHVELRARDMDEAGAGAISEEG
jgi:hypothetical protein